MDIILVHLGGDVPDYYWECVRQIRRFTQDRVVAVVEDESTFQHAPTDNVMIVRRKALPETKNWGRFKKLDFFGSSKDLWQYSCERLFVIESVMGLLNITKPCLHIEYDNLIYADPCSVGLDLIGDRVAITAISETAMSAGIMYVGSYGAMVELNHAMIHIMMRGHHELHKQYGDDMLNEMRLLNMVYTENPGMVVRLPTMPNEFPGYNGYIFDCASWGQWVGGAHHHGEEPFAIKKHFIGRKILVGELDLDWIVVDGLKRPVAVDKKTGEKTDIFNLHIHQKTLSQWRS